MEKGKVDMELIRRYVRGELPPREMYAVERQAEAEPMLMDIILGMEADSLADHDSHLADLRQRITARTTTGPQKMAVRRLAPVQRWALAASILTVFTVGVWWFTRNNTVTIHAEDALATVHSEAPRRQPEKQRAREPATSVAEREADAALPQVPPAVAKAAAKVATAPPPTAEEVQEAPAMDEIAEVHQTGRLAFSDTGRPDGIRIRGINAHSLMAGQARTIVGKVVDEETQEPLTGVTIQIGDQLGIITNQQGRFAATDTSKTLIIRFLGYESDTMRINGVDSIRIAMRPEKQQLSEAVVTEAPKGQPTPKEGWRAYQEYLKDAVKRASDKKGSVDLSFTVDNAGHPTNITVTNTTNEELNQLAIEIVREGPSWVPGADDERKVTLPITF